MNPTISCELDPRRMSREDALKLSDDEKRLYFSLVRLNHPRIAETLDTMTALATPSSGKNILLLTGPTGVGKSTLIQILKERMMQKHSAEIEADVSFIPVASMVAPASGERGFSWKMFYADLGKALNEPLMGKKLETKLANGRTLTGMPASSGNVTAMRMAVEGIIAQRRTKLIVIDEAVPLLRKAHGNSLDNHMDALKTLADKGATLVLIGSYDLHEIVGMSGQVARRTGIVHFGRYLTGVPDDERAFRSALQQLQSRLPIHDMPDLTERAMQLQIACVGCIGILKSVLSSTLECALAKDGKWDESYLNQSLLSVDLFETIMAETMAGEAKVRGTTLGSGTLDALVTKARAMEAAAVSL